MLYDDVGVCGLSLRDDLGSEGCVEETVLTYEGIVSRRRGDFPGCYTFVQVLCNHRRALLGGGFPEVGQRYWGRT